MKKRILAIITCGVLIFSIAGCGTSNTASTPEEGDVEEVIEEDGEEPEEDTTDKNVVDTAEELSIIETIQADFNATIELIENDLETVYADVGDTYDDYVKNKSYISEWYATCMNEAEELYARTYDASIDYYKFVADTIDHDDYDSINDALDDFYDDIIDEAMDDFYDDIIDEALDDIYDRYDKLIDDADEWDAWSDMYDAWSDTWSDMYDAWSDAWSDAYSLWSDIWAAFAINDNFDVDAILEERGNSIETVEANNYSTDANEEETFVESSNNNEVFIEGFNTNPTIEETVLWDEEDVKVTATSLDYNSWSVKLNMTIENKSDRTLDFANGSTNFDWYAINGYSIEGGFFSETVEPGETVEVAPSFNTSVLSAYGINEIAEIRMRLYYHDDDYNYVYLDERTLETTVADSYDFETDSYQECVKNGALAQIFGGSIEYALFDELYSNNDISMVSEVLISINEDDDETLGLMLEMVNNSDYNIYAVISDVYLNDEQAYEYDWTNLTMMPGTRGLFDIDLTTLAERRSWYDDDVEPIDLSDGVDSITFTLSIKNTSYEDALSPQEITIDFK